jgi:ribosomal-protein-alanine N-acetyltransferase
MLTAHRKNPSQRWMIRRDLEPVLEIEGLCFQYPWSEQDFTNFLRQRNGIGMVAEDGERIVGYCLYELESSWLHLANIAVLPAYQGKGVGATMIGKLISKLSPTRRHRITTNVRETNLDAQLFFKAMGFRWTATLGKYWEDSDTDEDAYVFAYKLPKEDE